jgi:hypothetical protein
MAPPAVSLLQCQDSFLKAVLTDCFFVSLVWIFLLYYDKILAIMEWVHCYYRECFAENCTLKRRCLLPKKVLPDELAFAQFEEKMTAEGFRIIPGPEFTKSFQRLGLSNPRKRTGREVGFTFSACGLTAVVWTTFLCAEKRARDQDTGWVLIAQGDKVKYFSHPMMRTSGFLDKLFIYARIAKQRVENRPLCPTCCAYMEIAMCKGLKSRYWRCSRKFHKNFTENINWDIGVSPSLVKFLESERRARRRYREQLKKEGKEVTPAMLKRRPWRMSKPQNKI